MDDNRLWTQNVSLAFSGRVEIEISSLDTPFVWLCLTTFNAPAGYLREEAIRSS